MQILLLPVFLLPVVCYLLAWSLATRRAAAVAGTMPGEASMPPARGLRTALLLIGLVLHAGSIAIAIRSPGGLRFGFAPASSAILWLGVALLWMESLRLRVEALLMLVLPVAAITCLLPLFFPGALLGATSANPLFVPHLVAGTLAYGVLLLAALYAGLLTAAERKLHGAPGNDRSIFARWLDDLPPLLVLERILFRFIAIGFALLTLTLVLGVVFTEEVFGRALRPDHKTVFTVIAWAMFGVLLGGRLLWGWRGRRALRLTLGAFGMLVLAYVGSRFVLEVILQRL